MSLQLLSALFRLISTTRLDLSSEKAAQAQLEAVLTERGYVFAREVRLSAHDRPDFLVTADGAGVVVEMKVGGAPKAAALRQLERYVKHDAVHGLLLASATSVQVPPEIGGKPAAFVSLGRAWL